LLLLRETYAPRILQNKTLRLRKATSNPNLRSKLDKGQKPSELFRLAITRPTKMIFRSPIVLILSIFGSIVYSYMYLLFTTFTSVFEDNYGFNAGEAGLAYLGLGVGFIIGQFGIGTVTDGYLSKQKAKYGESRPEDRLPLLFVGSFFVPAGLFWYGWTAEYHTHWIVPIIGTSLCGIGIIAVVLPVQMYLVDAYTLYAASAIAASTVVRSIFGVTVPLAGPALYERLGLGWGNSLLAFLALTTAPCSLLLIKYGERIRKNPRFNPNL
jgi:MFS family permease